MNTWYEVSVSAFTDQAESEPTVRTARTLASDSAEPPPPQSGTDLPPPPPLNVDAKPVNDTTITVHWTKPSFSFPVRYYTVRYKPVKDGIAMLTGDTAQEHFVET